MKTKFFYLTVCLLVVQILNAQTFRIKGGVNFNNVTVKIGGLSASPSSLTGYHAGVEGDFNLTQNLYFDTGLIYILKGFSGNFDPEHENTKVNETINYLEIPLNLAYKFPVNEKSKFFIQAGPYIGFGLSIKETVGGIKKNGSFKEAGLKNFDLGVGFGGGMEFGRFVALINYEVGLANINDTQEMGNVAMKNKVFQISLAYALWAKK